MALLQLIIVIIASLNFDSASATRRISCPAVDDSVPVYFVNPQNCAQFYQCTNGIPYLFDCPKGLVFDTVLNVCNYPTVVQGQCSSSPVAPMTTQSPINPPTAPPTAPSSVASTNQPTDPSTEAQTELPTEPTTKQPTASPTVAPMNPSTDPPTEAPTELPTTTTTKPPTAPPTVPSTNLPTEPPTVPPTELPTDSPTNLSCPIDSSVEIYYPHEKHCYNYYQCIDGTAVLQRCGPGLWFSMLSETCLRPKQSGCSHSSNNKVEA